MVGHKWKTVCLFLLIFMMVLLRAAHSQSLEPRKPPDWNVCKPIADSETNWQIITEGALCQLRQGKHEEVLRLDKKALEITERDFGPDHPNTGTSVHNVAFVLWRMGNFTEAEPLFKRALTIGEKNMDVSFPAVLDTIAKFYEDWGKYSIAEAYFERALALDEKKYSPHASEMPSSLNNLARIYKKQKRYSLALQFYNRKLYIEKKLGGADSLLVGFIYEDIADIYLAQGKYSKALRTYERALKIREESRHLNDEDGAYLLENLSTVYSKMSNNFLKRAQKIRKESGAGNKK